MNVDKKSVEELRRLYAEEFDEELTEEEAKRIWLDLMDFLTLLFKKTPEEMRQSSPGKGSAKMERTS